MYIRALLLVIRFRIIVIMNRLICTPRRRLIQVIPQVDIHFLSRTHIPRTRIRPLNTCFSPLQAVALPRKRTIRVLRLRESDAQAVVIDVARLADNGVEQFGGFAGCGDELDELAVYDLKLASGGVRSEEGGAGAVERGGLHVVVEVRCGDSADPVVAFLECRAGSAARWCSGRGCFAGLRWFWLWFCCGLGLAWGCTGLALRIVVTFESLEDYRDQQKVLTYLILTHPAFAPQVVAPVQLIPPPNNVLVALETMSLKNRTLLPVSSLRSDCASKRG
jgi:hypothetical protein